MSLGVEEHIFFCNLKLSLAILTYSYIFPCSRCKSKKCTRTDRMQIAKRRGDAYKECVATDHSTFPLQPIVLCRSLCPTRSGNWRHGWYILQGWYSQSIGFPPKAQVAWDQKQMEQDVQDWKLWKLCLSINGFAFFWGVQL